MSVYVDTVGRFKARWSHLQADTEEELHAFAAQLGLRREWFQPGSRPEAAHYDVTDRLRDHAIRRGAIPETMEEGSARRRRARESRSSIRDTQTENRVTRISEPDAS